jgi:hypothetical protein
MATQQTGTPPNTRRLGIFPDSIRKFVIVFMIILFLIGGIIGIQQAWGNLSNILAVIFGVVGVVLGILTFWPSTKANEASAPVSPVSPQLTPVQVNIYNNPGQLADPQNIHSSMTINANNNKPGDPNAAINTSAANPQQPPNNMPVAHTPVQPAPMPSQPAPMASPPVEPAPAINPSPTVSPVSPAPSLSQSSQGNDESPVNRAVLLKELANEPPGVFQMVVSYLKIPASNLSGISASPAIRAEEVLTLVGNEHLQRVQDALNWATGRNDVEDVRPEAEPRTRGAREQKRDAVKQYPEEPLPNTLRGCIETAQWNVDQAYDLLDPEVEIFPEDIVNAAQSLETAKKDIEHLKKLLQETPSHPKYWSISDQVPIITEQIKCSLIPYLKPTAPQDENYQKRFVALRNALKILDILIPE